VHYQAPGSVIAYYQQVGRAGRAIERAEVVLLRGREDRRIQDFFIEQAFPRRDIVETVLTHLAQAGDEGAPTAELTSLVNLGKGRIDAMLKVLDVEGAVTRSGTRWVRERDGDWAYDAERYAKVTELRRREQTMMASFGADGRCLMRALQEELDDPDPQDCGRCSVCAGPRYDARPEPELVRAALEHLRSRPLTLDAKKMSPDPDGKMRRIGADVQVAEGRALARIGDGGWDPLVQDGRREGRFGDELVRATAELVRAWDPPATWVAAVPSNRSGTLVPDFAQRLAATLGLEYVPALERVENRSPQREMANAVQQVANVRGAFAVTSDPPKGPCLLVDDLRHSGWTQAMTGGQLRRRGAGEVYPLVLTTAF